MRDLEWTQFDVLVVDDEQDNLDAFRFAFRKSFRLSYALGGDEALGMLDRLDPAVIISDQRMPGLSGIQLLEQARRRRPDAVGILLTAYAELPVLIDAVNSGAVERYVAKPWDSKELGMIVRQAISKFSTARENRRLREQLAQYAGYLEREQRDPIDFGELTGDSAPMRAVLRRIEEVAPTSTHVLVEGEAGTEKDVVARAVHVGSSREEQPFVKVTCAAFAGEALEREVFGWERGAYEGAFTERAGRAELAHGGTLYLEEPGCPTPTLQARLLRMLEHGETERMGGLEPQRVDLRVIVSLTPESHASWRAGGVLPELLARLSVFPVTLAPVRERRADVAALAAHFLRKYARRNPRAARTLAPEALSKLESYAWPGNVREIENVIERAAILSRGDEIRPEHLAFSSSSSSSSPSRRGLDSPPEAPPAVLVPQSGNLDAQLEELERRELLAALSRCGGNKAEVARSLGVQRTTLYYRLKKLGIDA